MSSLVEHSLFQIKIENYDGWVSSTYKNTCKQRCPLETLISIVMCASCSVLLLVLWVFAAHVLMTLVFSLFANVLYIYIWFFMLQCDEQNNFCCSRGCHPDDSSTYEFSWLWSICSVLVVIVCLGVKMFRPVECLQLTHCSFKGGSCSCQRWTEIFFFFLFSLSKRSNTIFLKVSSALKLLLK